MRSLIPNTSQKRSWKNSSKTLVSESRHCVYRVLIVSIALTFTPWFKLIAKSFLYKWWDILVARSKSLTLLEGTHRDATSHPSNGVVHPDQFSGPADASKSNVAVDVEVLRDLITDKDKNEILRF